MAVNRYLSVLYSKKVLGATPQTPLPSAASLALTPPKEKILYKTCLRTIIYILVLNGIVIVIDF